ncbi:MAG: hypothetical protein JSU59_02205 [Nitrospirota bacterium]|nr:MAG: hypothetical protein JSU59_02205 [Nitrospirota bacterium]
MGIRTPPTSIATRWSWVFCILLIFQFFFPPSALAFDPWVPSRDQDPLILAQAQPPPPTSEPTSPPVDDQPATGDEEEEEEEEEGPARIPLAGVQQGGVLLQRDQLVLEPTLAYSFSSNSRLILTGFSILPLLILGTIEAEKIDRTTFSPALGFRYGVRRGIQADVRIPFALINTTRTRVFSDSTGQGASSGESSGLGDVSFGLSYQFLYERAWFPDMVFRLGASAPTGRSQFDIFEDIIATGNFESIDVFEEQLTAQGTALGAGNWGIDGTITGVKALDPAILFGTLGYNYSPPQTKTVLQLSADPNDPRRIKVIKTERDIEGTSGFSVSLGMAISLNNQLSMNWSFAQNYRFAVESGGQKVPDSQVNAASFNMGFNIAVTPRITTNISGSIGITPDAPDFGFSLTTPVSFTNALGSTLTWIKEHRPFKSKPAPAIPEEEPEAPGEPEAPAPPTQKEPSTETSAPPKAGNGNNGPPSTKEPQK